MKPSPLFLRSHIFAALALSALTNVVTAQQTRFGNLNVVQNDALNNGSSVTLSLTEGSTGGFCVAPGSSRGDFVLDMTAGSDRDAGVLMTSISQLSRDNTAQGDTIGQFYATSAIDYTGTPADYFIPIHTAPAGGEANINVAAAFFPYSQWIGGFANNSAGTNGGANNQFFRSTGLVLGTHLTTLTAATNNGQFVVNINGFTLGAYTAPALASQNGILLVSGAKNEDNYALSRANANGTFNIFVKDNGTNSTTFEQDPVAFVYIPTTAVGTRNLVAMGRVKGNASKVASAGTSTVTKGPTGTWYLSIPGQTNETGTLLISPEGGTSGLNPDNIVSYEWDGANSRWIIESRDLPQSPPTLQDTTAAPVPEDTFSFAFFQAPPRAHISPSFTGAAGDPVVDADLGTTGNQAAVTGTSAFATIASAVTTAGSMSPLFLNGGTYNEPLNLGSDFALTVTGTNTNQNVVVGSLAGQDGSSVVIQGGSGITFGGNDTTTVMNGKLSGGPLSSLIKNGTGTLSLNGKNSLFAGSLTINGGGVLVDDLGFGGDFNADLITINNGGVFTFGATGDADFPDSTDIVINSGGRFELGQGEFYGTITLDGGEFRFFSTSRTGVNNTAVVSTAGGTAYDARSGSFTTSFSGGGTGGALQTGGVLGHFVKTTAGTVTMGNGTSLAATMPVEVREGTLAFSGTHTVSGTAPLTLGTATTAGTIRADAGVTTISRALTTAAGGSTLATQAAGTLNLTGSISGGAPLALSSSGMLNFAPVASQVQSVDVVLTGSSPISKSDLGTTEFSAISPFSGQINVKDGVLILSGEVAGSVVVEDLGTLRGEGTIGGNLDLGQVLGAQLQVNADTPGTLEVSGIVNLVGESFVGLSGLPSGTGTLSIPVLGYGTLTGFSASALVLEAASTYRAGSGVFTDDAPNSQILMSLETKSLIWTGNAGIWDRDTTDDWQSGGNPELFFSGDSVTFNDTSENAEVTLAGELRPGAFTVDSDMTNYSVSGTPSDYISGSTLLLKRGSSMLVMDAPNTFDGGTIVEEGVLEIRQVDGVGFGPLAVGSPSTGSADTAFYLGAQRISFGQDVIVAGGTGTATLGSRSTITGTGDNNQFTSISLARNVIFDSNAADRTDYENITGNGNITVTGTGRSIFTTTPALFTGDVRVSTTGTGNLQVGVASTAGDRIPDASSVTVDAGATLRISTSAETIGALNGAGTVVGFAPSGGSAILTIGSGNFSGVIEGLMAGDVLGLVKTGAGQLVLSGNNTNGGTTTVSAGTLRVGDSGATGDLGSGAVTVADGATLSYLRTGAVTQDGGLNSTGAVGAANLIVGGDSSTQVTLGAGGNFSGAITVNQGTLVFGVSNPVAIGVSAPSITLASGTTLTNGTPTTHAHIGILTMAGGATITTSSGTGTYNTENYQLNGDVTVSGGSVAAAITRDVSRTNANSGMGLRGTRTFTVADVTSSAAADLVVSTELEPSDLNTGADEGALIKQGSGTMQLAGGIAHSYTGPTTVQAGTLVADGSIPGSLTVSATATIAPGASAGSFGAGATTINGTYLCEVSGAASDVLNVTGNLQLGAASALSLVAVGGGFTEPEYIIATWTGTLTGTFATVTGKPTNYTLNYDETNKRIMLVATGNPYTTWETAQGIAGAGSAIDSDNDGIANGIEFVIGGDPSGPNSDSNSLLPSASVNAGYLDFVFRRTDESSGFGPYVEYGSDLDGWTTAVNGANGIIIEVDNDHFGLGIDRVTVRIPQILATNSKLFARMGISTP